MLFFPKYGTIGVCAPLTPAWPATSAAATNATTDGAKGGRRGTRWRICSSSGDIGKAIGRSLADLTCDEHDPANADPEPWRIRPERSTLFELDGALPRTPARSLRGGPDAPRRSLAAVPASVLRRLTRTKFS